MAHIPFFYSYDMKTLGKEETHHFFKVLRKKEGDKFKVCDGQGNIWLAYAREKKGDKLLFELEQLTEKKEKKKISLGTAMPKGQRMAYLVEKSSEIGVDKIYPLITKYSSIKEFTEGMIRRMNAIAKSACMQSEKGFLTKIEKPIKLFEVFEKLNNIGILEKSGKKENWEFFKEKGEVLLVGPEGGWAEEEIKIFEDKGLLLLKLIEEPLRTETAVVVGLAFYYSLKF